MESGLTGPQRMIPSLSASERRSGVWLCGPGSSSTSGPAFVNRPHDFLSPPDRIRDCAHGRRNSLPALELCQLSCSEDTCRNQQHAFAALVHAESLSVSLFVRL